jgi:methylated-DNA-[protein]-cysteine S-methyltransferase
MSLVETLVDTPLGAARLAATEEGLTGLWFRGQQHEPRPLRASVDAASDTVLAAAARWLSAYFTGLDAPPPPTDPGGTPFQHQVWEALRAIPRGTTSSYSAMARQIGRPEAVRAVAAAIGRNPLSILVPCHRVLGSGGALTGYAGGLGRKRALLALDAGQGLPWRRVRESCVATYPDPITVEIGDKVRWVDREDDGEYVGWKWAIGPDGREGWAPQGWFTVTGHEGRARRAYSASELPVSAGDEVLPLDGYSGWLWVIDRSGRCGWVLESALAV